MSSGAGWKISGASILAIYWILACMIEFVIPENAEGLMEEAEMIVLLFSWQYRVHAIGFTLILFGFLQEKIYNKKTEMKLEFIWEKVEKKT